MRPFKFFFAISLAFILFGFLARFIIVALVMAAAFSLVFFLGRKIKNFFRDLSWEHERRYSRKSQLPVWKDDLLLYFPAKRQEYQPEYQPEYRNRTIEVR